MSRRILFAGLALILSAAPVFAQTGPRVIKMTIAPAPAPTPALKHQLIPELRDLKSGNAAVFYQRSQSLDWWSQPFRQEVGKLGEALEQPWDKSFADKYAWLATRGPLKELDYAARCENCDWQMLDRVRAEGLWLTVPDLQGMRNLGTLTAGRARIEIHRGEFDKAIFSLQSGFALSKHLSESSLLIYALVANAVANATLNRVEEFVQAPGAPNLYWALTDLPQPLIDLRRPLQGERMMMHGLFPEIREALKDPKLPPLSASQFGKRIEQKMAPLGMRPDPISLMFAVARNYPAAKTYFVEQGRSEAAIDAFPVTQLVLMRELALNEVWADEAYKLNNLPYWEAQARHKAFDQSLLKENKDRGGLTFPQLVHLPSERIFATRARIQRRLALLRCVEALRLYAAGHDHGLPPSLDTIREVPIPVDPMTGRSFAYRLEQGSAVLEAEAGPSEEATQDHAVRIEIRLAAAPKK